jgi:hypothetical protein
MTNKGRDMIDRGRIVNRFESENWSIIVSEVDNFIKVNVQGKRDHRDRVMWWKQSRRLFPEIRDENDE